MSARAYIRVFTDQTERWAGLSDGEYRLLMDLTLLAAQQHPPGRFRSVEVLRAFTPTGLRRHLKRLYEQGHLLVLPTGEVYLDEWDEDQEGDWKAAERMARRRARKRGSGPPAVTSDTPTTVTTDANAPVTPPYSSGSGKSISNGSGRLLPPTGEVGITRYSDAYKAYRHVTGVHPDARQQKWLDDLSAQFGREHVARTIYDQPDYTERGLLARITATLRGAQ